MSKNQKVRIDLFDQDYATEGYARERSIETCISTCKEFGASIDDTIKKVAKRFELMYDDAADYVKYYWENK